MSPMSRIILILCCGVAIVAKSALARQPDQSSPPTTRETTRSTADTSGLAEAIIDLGSDDPVKRWAARDQLMLLSMDDPEVQVQRLRDVVQTLGELSPQMEMTLRDVVVHLWLASQHNFAGNTSGLMGVQLSTRFADGDNQLTCVVLEAYAGTDAYRVLRAGDVIQTISLVTNGFDGVAGPSKVVVDAEELRSVLRVTRAGDWVQLGLVRDGRAMTLRVRLSQPIERNIGANENPAAAVYRRGLGVWTEQFAPLIEQARRSPTPAKL